MATNQVYLTLQLTGGASFYNTDYMAYKRIGGWLIPNRLYMQVKIANGLWYFSRRDDSDEKQVSLFFIGWYERRGPAKLFTINILWLSFQVGFAI